MIHEAKKEEKVVILSFVFCFNKQIMIFNDEVINGFYRSKICVWFVFLMSPEFGLLCFYFNSLQTWKTTNALNYWRQVHNKSRRLIHVIGRAQLSSNKYLNRFQVYLPFSLSSMQILCVWFHVLSINTTLSNGCCLLFSTSR